MSEDVLAQIKALLKSNPEILKEVLADQQITPNGQKVEKTTLKVIDQYGEVTCDRKEMDSAQKIEVPDNSRRQARPPIKRVERRCGCGRTEMIVAGSILDVKPFMCNSCGTN